jgi:D-3-phosphoglycerate dehydrogenase
MPSTPYSGVYPPDLNGAPGEPSIPSARRRQQPWNGLDPPPAVHLIAPAGTDTIVVMRAIFIDCNDQLAPVWRKVIRADDPKIDVNRTPFSRDDLPRLAGPYDIVLDDHSYMPTELVAQCGRLKHIVFLGTGAASYMDVDELRARGVTVHTIKGYGDVAVAEHAIALMFAAARDVAGMDRELRGGSWTPREGVQLAGKTLGVIGLGGIGAEVARIGAGIGMRVVAYNRTPRQIPGVAAVDIDTLLAGSDVVSMNLALNDGTRGFLGKERIERMKPGAIFVNTARGALVDEEALIAALRRGHIRHAGLDVFHDEPLQPDHPLAKMPNVTLTAHAAFRTLEASMTLLRRAIDIVKTIVG